MIDRFRPTQCFGVLLLSAVIGASCAPAAQDEEAGEEHSAELASPRPEAEDRPAMPAPEGEGEGEHAEEEGEHSEGRESSEHDGGEHSEGGEGEGEESGVYIGAGDTWDEVRRGARLVMAYSGEHRAFTGRVVNTTTETLCAVRVEVHLSNGTELGPTARTDVAAGESLEVGLAAGDGTFDSWTAHPEMSNCPG